MNLKEWAALQGVHYKTAYHWYRTGKLPVPARRVGKRLILVDQPLPSDPKVVAAYAWVSSPEQAADLNRQVARVTEWASARHLAISTVVTEVGPAWTGQRKELLALLADPKVDTIVIERRDRLARVGAEYVEAVLAAQGRRLLVVDPSEEDGDLDADVTELLRWLHARLSGRQATADDIRRTLETIGLP
jgi:predicted site-specific integrase-resolvase